METIIPQCLPHQPLKSNACCSGAFAQGEQRVIHDPREHSSCGHLGELLGRAEKVAAFGLLREKKKTTKKLVLQIFFLIYFLMILAPTPQNNRFVAKIRCDILRRGKRK